MRLQALPRLASNVSFKHHTVEFDVGVLCFELERQLLEFDHCFVANRSDNHGFLLSQGRWHES